MPSDKKEATATEHEHALLLGELLAATKATRDAITSLVQDQKDQAHALAQTTATLKMQTRIVDQLCKLVRDGNGDSLLTRVRLVEETLAKVGEALADGDANLVHRDAMRAVEKAATDLEARVAALEDHGGELDTARSKIAGARSLAIWTAGIIAWLITTGIALYAALTQ